VAAAAATAPAALSNAATPAAVRLYFELGKAALPADAPTQLAPLIATAKDRSGATWVISGYHDASGDAAANAELAKQRAFAVRDALVAAGVPAAAIELSKPIQTLGGSDPREARRVEVTLR
jgi:outer membrane protein OmpA-like peptidoglycan-associated protein